VQLSPGLENIAQCPQCMVQCCQHCLHVMPSHKHVSWRTTVRSRVQPDWRSHTFSTIQFQLSICRCYSSNTSFKWLTESWGFALATYFVTVNTPKYFRAQYVKTFHVYTRLHVRTVWCPGLNESDWARGTKSPYTLPNCKVRWAPQNTRATTHVRGLTV